MCEIPCKTYKLNIKLKLNPNPLPFIAYKVLVKLLLWLLAISGVSSRSAKDVLLYEEKYESFFSIQARMFWKLLLVFSTECSTSFSSKFGVVITLGTWTSIIVLPPPPPLVEAADNFSTFSGRWEEVMVMLGGTSSPSPTDLGSVSRSTSGELQVSRLWSLQTSANHNTVTTYYISTYTPLKGSFISSDKSLNF